jgi:hypothetical protein
MKMLLVSVWSAMLAACIGGQPKQVRQQSDQLGNQAGNVPPSTLSEHDWQKAAQGHGAAGVIPAEDLARMEKRSAPGGNLADAGR